MSSDLNDGSIHISLPEPLKEFVDELVSAGAYASTTDFVEEAIREKCRRDEELLKAEDELAAKLQEGLDSGEPMPLTQEMIDQLKDDLIRRFGKSKSA